MKREFLEGLQMDGQPLSGEVIDAILAESDKTVQLHKQSAADWENKYTQAVAAHEKQMADMVFSGIVKDAVTAAGGRNVKAITALLDVEALSKSEDPAAAVMQALEVLKKENDYLFATHQTPPPYARGTGASAGTGASHPVTLAGALREKYERK